MNNNHWVLLIFWIAYCFLHSFLANSTVKSYIQKFMGSAFKYYRPLYAIFAAITLVLILWFQFSIQSTRLFAASTLLFMPAIITTTVGIVIMIICINKYFYELSGLQALQQSNVKNTLQQSGLHKFVRHPLYLGTLLFIWGLLAFVPFLNNLLAVITITIYVLLGIRLEEKKLYEEYGESYKDYAKKVPKLFPRLYAIKKGST